VDEKNFNDIDLFIFLFSLVMHFSGKNNSHGHSTGTTLKAYIHVGL